MFRFMFAILITLFCASNAVSFADEEQKIKSNVVERMSLIKWVSQNNKKLSESSTTQIVDNVLFHSQQNNLDPYLVFSMIRAESSYKPRAISKVGAKGLMQVWPKWHKDKIKGRDPFSIAVNVEVGVQIISECVSKGSGNIYKALKCYSGGAGSKYRNRIAMTHKELKEQNRVVAILNDVRPTAKYAFDKPRIKQQPRNNDVLLAFIQTIPS